MKTDTIEIDPEKCIQINENGRPVFQGQEILDEAFLNAFYKSLRKKDHYFTCRIHNRDFLVEAYDQVLVPQSLEITDSIRFALAKDVQEEVDLNTLCLDDWDRLLGRTKNDLPFVLSRSAQEQIFSTCDFDDDSIVFNDVRYETPSYYQVRSEVSQSQWWSAKYKDNPQPGWELNHFHPVLTQAAKTLKLNKSKILVLGCGSGNDAAFFASMGHLVTAVDFSPLAISKAKQKYGESENLKFIQADFFTADFKDQFDIVFDHTSYCAIDPNRRNELVKVWRTCLREGGHLLGIFFSFDKREGPPFGGSEWELRKRCEKYFRFLYWNRVRVAPSYNRYGIEFIVWAAKL